MVDVSMFRAKVRSVMRAEANVYAFKHGKFDVVLKNPMFPVCESTLEWALHRAVDEAKAELAVEENDLVALGIGRNFLRAIENDTRIQNVTF